MYSQAGAITVGQKGEELADIEGMAKAGIPAISEDGKSVMNALLYKEAMEIAAEKTFRCWLTARTRTS